jgi:hypothetical protein
MIYMWFTDINYYKLAVKKELWLYFYDHYTTVWEPGFNVVFRMTTLLR